MDLNHNDDIDIKKLFNLIWMRRKIVFFVTFSITLVTIAYAFSITPLYEAKAIIKIGEYKTNSTEYNGFYEMVSLDNGNQLSKELEILFMDLEKNKHDKESRIILITLLKNQKNLIEIKSLATSNILAVKKIKEVVHYVQKKHQKVLDEIKVQNTFKIDSIKRTIARLEENEVPLLNKQIKEYKQNISVYEKNFFNTQKNLQKLKIPTLAVLEINQQRYLSETLTYFKQNIRDLESKKYYIENEQIINLQQKKEGLENLLLPHNYTNSKVIGEYISDKTPIKPMKTIMGVTAFVMGLILSVFSVFMVNLFRLK